MMPPLLQVVTVLLQPAFGGVVTTTVTVELSDPHEFVTV